MSESKIIVALDYPDPLSALTFVDQIEPAICKLKVGKELFTRAGPEFVRVLVEKGYDVFLDLKFHDIPNTVKNACHAAADLGVWMLNVHASGGRAMLEAAVEGRDKSQHNPFLIAVTVLTSMDNQALEEIGVSHDAPTQVLRLAQLVHDCRLDGVVCSAQEATLLRKQHAPPFLLVTPGIRLENNAMGDQKRVMTPQNAMAAGASYLVIGRPITQSDKPISVLNNINSLIS